MAWTENIDTNIVVVTGDGKTYTPLYRIAERNKEYNTAEFNFIGVSGTLVDRRLPKSYRQTIDLIFQGEDHLEDYKTFILSADDVRPWNVYHPMYGNITVHPLRVNEDPKGLGLTELRVDWMETITTVNPSVVIDPQEKVQLDSVKLSETAAQSFENNLNDPSVTDLALMQSQMDSAYSISNELEKTGPEANKYFDLYTVASNKLNEGIDRAQQLAFASITVMTYPSYFTAGIKPRLNILKKQFLSLSAQMETLNNFGKKTVYETMAGSIVNAMANASVTTTTENNLNSATEVVEAAEILSSVYNSFLVNLDFLQTPDVGRPNSYTPDVNFMSGLDILVNLAVSQLLNIALESQQERVITLEKDSNVINLVHRFYGITSGDDSEITRFMDQNNIGLNEMLQVKKGRSIVYYV